MSIHVASATATLRCDRCPTKAELPTITIKGYGLATATLPEGWVRQTDGIDLCPTCTTKRRAPWPPPIAA